MKHGSSLCLAFLTAQAAASGVGSIRSPSLDVPRSLGGMVPLVPFDLDCTALVGIAVDIDDPQGQNQTFLSCLTSDGMIYDLHGVCQEWIEDRVKRNKLFSNSTRIDVSGSTFDDTTDEIFLGHFPPEFLGRDVQPWRGLRSMGERYVLAVRVVLEDGEPTVTEDDVRDSIFGDAPDSLKNHLGACSQEKLTLLPRNVSAILGGPVITGPKTEETLARCMAEGLGEEYGKATNVEENGQSGNFLQCPADSFFCYGGEGTYGKEFAMPNELPQGAGESKVLTCVATGDQNTVVEVNVTTHRPNSWFQFEIKTQKYFISMVQLKAGNAGGETIFQYDNYFQGIHYDGARAKTGVLMTPLSNKVNYRDISHVAMCVMPRTKACEKLDSMGETPVDNEDVPYGFHEGVITVTIPNRISDGDTVIRNQVTRQLVKHFGIQNPEEIADYVMYCYPAGVMDREAYGFIYSWLSVYSDKYCVNLAAQMRELGHNFGLGPSRMFGKWDGDYTGMMGDAHFDRPAKCFNAPKLAQSGWYDPEEHVFYGNDDPMTVSLWGFMKTPEVPGRMKILQFDRASPVDLYMTCNWAYGRHAQTHPEYANKVTIALQGHHGVQFDVSYLMAVLDVGETYYYPRYYDKRCDLNITLLSFDETEGLCEVFVSGCIPDAPSPAPTPKPTGPTKAPTPPPVKDVPPPPACYAAGELCSATTDCCDEGNGHCFVLSARENYNLRIVCVAEGADPGTAVGPPGPGGSCNDNNFCEVGENCFSCPHDCNAMLAGPEENRYCCDGGTHTLVAGQTSYLEAPFAIPITDPICDCGC